MLKGISPLIGPELLALLYRMGHGDELVLADAHFPAYTFNDTVLRADGIAVVDLLGAILPLYELDSYVDHPAIMMATVEGDTADPSVAESYNNIISKNVPLFSGLHYIERFAFYERARSASAIVISGETRKYGNIIIKKGVTPVG